jgi:hypothetical protein
VFPKLRVMWHFSTVIEELYPAFMTERKLLILQDFRKTELSNLLAQLLL